jgi:RHS repeat-associated protein
MVDYNNSRQAAGNVKAKESALTIFFATLLLCFINIPHVFAANSSPSVGSITPINSTSQANSQVIFTTTYSDPDGWQNIRYAQVLINTSIKGANGFLGYYIQNTNKLYLMNDAGTSYQGGYAPGSANTIENSYVKIDCAQTTVSGTGTTMTVKWAVTFKDAFVGKKNVYMYVKDDANAYHGWINKGRWTINVAPTVDSLSPTSGVSLTDQAVTFTTVFSDQNGWQDIKYVHLLINTSISGSKGFLGYYVQNTNKLYLRNDADSVWIGGYTPGSANVIENSYVKLDCSQTSVSGSGNTMTINWSVIFKPTCVGAKKCYLYAKDDTNVASGWAQKGTWSINQGPGVDSLSPDSGMSNAGQEVTITTVFSDLDGWQNIQYVHILMNTGISGTNGFLGYYHQNTNKLYLMNDAGTGWLGGYAPGSANVIENAYVKVDCAKTAIVGSGNTMTVNWVVTFKSAFAGMKNVYLFVRDDYNAYYGWIWKGTWLINQAPTVDTLVPDNGSSQAGEEVVFTTTFSDLDGWQNIQYVHFMVNTGISGVNGCIGYYVQNTNKLYMLNDTGSVWQGGFAPGSANVIENSYAKIDCAKTTVSGSGNTMTVKWGVTFKEPFVGVKNIYLFVRDDNNAYYGWILKGGWTVNPPPATVVERIYVYMNGQRIAMEERKDGESKKYFFHNDHLGGTNVVTDEAGNQVKYAEYKPFGETKVEQGSLSVKRKFTGKELDDSTGLYDYSARMYDAKIGRFISADPIEFSEESVKIESGLSLQEFIANPQRLNRYSYCLNNPLKYLDPTGKDVVGIHGAITGQPQGLSPVLETVRNIFPNLPYSNLDWRPYVGFNISLLHVDIWFRPVFLDKAVAKVSSYRHSNSPYVYVGHSRGADSILESLRLGRIPANKDTRLILLGANRDVIEGALGALASCGNVLIIAGERDHFGGDRSYKSIRNLDIPSNVKVVSTRVGHMNMSSAKEVQNLVNQNKDWLK